MKWLRLVFLIAAWGALPAEAQGRLSIGPYASVSSSKSIKPKNSSSETEVVTQRTTYGLKVDIRLSRLFTFTVNGGVNAVDTTKKTIAMRDEYGDINFQKDANVDPNKQDEEYRYKEEQRLGAAQLTINPPIIPGMVWIEVGAGVRARQRLIDITNKATNEKSSVHDPIRYNAVGVAGWRARLLRAFTGGMQYKFYFIKFPKTQPHEQEVSVNFGVSI